MPNQNANPLIDINIDCEGWPNETKLLELISGAIASTINISKAKIPEESELSVLFCDDSKIKQLNASFRDIDKATNVLSFPYIQSKPEEMPGDQLGDLAFALQTISNEANLENKSFDNHLSHLIIHGFLHLLGYDHENDADADIMEALEIEALSNLGIENPYLEQ